MAKSFDYTKEQDEWLKDNFNKFNTTKELVNEFNIIFNTNYKYDTIKKHCIKKLNLVRNKNSTKDNLNVYTSKEIEWFEKNYQKYLENGCFDKDRFVIDFKNKFGKILNGNKLNNFIYLKTNVKFGRNAKLLKPKAQLPIGTERKIGGKWYVKIRNNKHIKSYTNPESNWQVKSRYVYEKYHNIKLSNKDHIIHLNNDYDDFSIENLIKLNEIEFNYYIGNKFTKLKNLKLKRCAILYSQIQAKLKER